MIKNKNANEGNSKFSNSRNSKSLVSSIADTNRRRYIERVSNLWSRSDLLRL
jgi:hypothetical protein